MRRGRRIEAVSDDELAISVIDEDEAIIPFIATGNLTVDFGTRARVNGYLNLALAGVESPFRLCAWLNFCTARIAGAEGAQKLVSLVMKCHCAGVTQPTVVLR